MAADLVAEVELAVHPVIFGFFLSQRDGGGEFVVFFLEYRVFLIKLREGFTRAAVREQLFTALLIGNQAVQRGQVAHRLRR